MGIGRVAEMGRRVRELRLERGLTQRALGALLEVSDVAVAQFESRGVDRISSLERLAWALDCDVVVELRPREVALPGESVPAVTAVG